MDLLKKLNSKNDVCEVQKFLNELINELYSSAEEYYKELIQVKNENKEIKEINEKLEEINKELQNSKEKLNKENKDISEQLRNKEIIYEKLKSELDLTKKNLKQEKLANYTNKDRYDELHKEYNDLKDNNYNKTIEEIKLILENIKETISSSKLEDQKDLLTVENYLFSENFEYNKLETERSVVVNEEDDELKEDKEKIQEVDKSNEEENRVDIERR